MHYWCPVCNADMGEGEDVIDKSGETGRPERPFIKVTAELDETSAFTFRFVGDTLVLDPISALGSYCINCGNRLTITDYPGSQRCTACLRREV